MAVNIMILNFYVIFLLVAFDFEKSMANKNHTGICGKSPFECCNNYYRENDECLEFPSGRYHYNCSEKCPVNHFGRLCLEICNCTSDEACDVEKGCTDVETKEKNISFQLPLLSLCVLFAVLTVILISYNFARKRKRQYSLEIFPEVMKTSCKTAEGHNNVGKQERNNINLNFAIPQSSARSTGSESVWKSHESRCSEVKKVNKTLPNYTFRNVDCDVSLTSISFLSDRRDSAFQKWPISRTYSDTSSSYLRPLSQTLASSTGRINCSCNSKDQQACEMSTYVEVNVNWAELEESCFNRAVNKFDRLSQHGTEDKVDSISEDGIYDLAFPDADQKKWIEVLNSRHLFLKDLSNHIFKMSKK